MTPARARFRDIVTIGASAGGAQTLAELVAGLPPELPATLLVAQHISATAPAVLPGILSRAGRLPASAAVDGAALERGHIYVAPPDHHLLLGDDRLILTRGPRENGHRPAVDPLFRSAARRYGRRVIAAVLSGTLDDGTAGLVAVKARGGVAVVQDPDDALHRGMPQSAIEGDRPDYVVPVSELADLLCTLVQEPLSHIRSELDEEEAMLAWSESREQGAKSVPVTCPECDGPLFEHQEGRISTFECLVGHRFSTASLDAEQERHLEAALWNAVRSLYERADVLRRLAHRRDDAPGLSRRHHVRAKECEEQAEAIIAAIQRLGSDANKRAEART